MRLGARFIRALRKTYGFFRLLIYFPRSAKKIGRIVHSESFYPEYPRKSASKIRQENLAYLLKYGEVNPYYISHGLDAEGFRNPEDFLTHRDFIILRNKGNQKTVRTGTGKYNYMVLLRDKYVFAAFLASTIGKAAVVPTLALITGGRVYLAEKRRWTELAELLKEDDRLVLKVLDGECADGVFLLERKAERYVLDGEEEGFKELETFVQDKKIIVQRVVEQHAELKRFMTKGVNTIRIVTIRGKSGIVSVFAAFLRLSASKDSFVDNRAKGGLGVGIELETGRLMRYGFPHEGMGTKTEFHPLSGIRFSEFTIPYWDEVKALVIAAHCQFYEFQSIGWDVIVTPEGPVLLEGNDDWEIGGPQDTYGGLKKRWKELTEG